MLWKIREILEKFTKVESAQRQGLRRGASPLVHSRIAEASAAVRGLRQSRPLHQL